MSAIPSALQPLLDLFATDLSDVRFGDVDGKTLAVVAGDVDAAAQAAASAQAAADAARAALQERQEALLQHAHRALAYAKVYAETNTALAARLDAIALPRAARRARTETPDSAPTSEAPVGRRPRGRPRKTPIAQPSPAVVDAVAE